MPPMCSTLSIGTFLATAMTIPTLVRVVLRTVLVVNGGGMQTTAVLVRALWIVRVMALKIGRLRRPALFPLGAMLLISRALQVTVRLERKAFRRLAKFR